MFCLPVSLSVSLSASLSVCLSVCMSVSVCLPAQDEDMDAAPEDFRTILQTFLLPFYTAYVSCTLTLTLVPWHLQPLLSPSLSLSLCLPAPPLLAQTVLASLKKPMYCISLEEDFLIVFRKVCSWFQLHRVIQTLLDLSLSPSLPPSLPPLLPSLLLSLVRISSLPSAQAMGTQKSLSPRR